MSIEKFGMNDATAVVGVPETVSIYGALTLLAAHCPLHSAYPAGLLNRLFLPAVERKCVRLFQNADGLPCAALIWARLSPDVAERMIADNIPPKPEEWNSGPELWFMDILAPFGHGAVVARHLARNPPAEAFSFARVGPNGKLRKVVMIDDSASPARAIRALCFATGLAG